MKKNSDCCSLSLSSSSLLLLPLLLLFAHPVVQSQEAPDASMNLNYFESPPLGTFRNDFCDLSFQVVKGDLPLDQALQGVDLRVLLMDDGYSIWDVEFDENNEQVTKRNLNAEYPGIVPQLLDELCDRAGCTWRNSYGFVQGIIPADNNFQDVLTWSTDVYDISSSWWMKTVDRLSLGITYLGAWYDGTITMVGFEETETKDKFDPWDWLAPFDYGVWLTIVGTVIFSTHVYSILEKPYNGEWWRIIRIENPSDVIWRFATSATGQFEFEPKTPPQRLLTFSISMWALLLTSAYTANLASFLVIRNKPAFAVETVDEAVNLEISLCVFRGSLVDTLMGELYPAYAASGLLVRRRSYEALYSSMRAGECGFVLSEVSAWDTHRRDLNINGDCSLGRIGLPLESHTASFAMKGDTAVFCSSFLREVLDIHMQRMQNDGTIAVLWQEQSERLAEVTCGKEAADGSDDGNRRGRRRRLEDTTNGIFLDQRRLKSSQKGGGAGGGAAATIDGGDDGAAKLTLVNMGGVFLLHGVLSVLSLIWAILGRARKRRKAKKEEAASVDTTKDLKEEEPEDILSVAKEIPPVPVEMDNRRSWELEMDRKMRHVEDLLMALSSVDA